MRNIIKDNNRIRTLENANDRVENASIFINANIDDQAGNLFYHLRLVINIIHVWENNKFKGIYFYVMGIM